MKASELVKELTALIEKYGDLDVITNEAEEPDCELTEITIEEIGFQQDDDCYWDVKARQWVKNEEGVFKIYN